MKKLNTICDCYNYLDNYSIKVCNPCSNKCLVCFSSDGLYHKFKKNNEEKVKCLINGRFEFQNITKSKQIEKYFNKIIYVRDVNLHFYLDGINSSISSFEKLIIFLNRNIGSLECYLVGSSSGGYAAFLAGFMLNNVKRVYTFGGIIEPFKYEYFWVHYEDFQLDETKEKYFSIVERMKNMNFDLFAFYSNNNQFDKDVSNKLLSLNIDSLYLFKFKTNFHAETVWSYDFKYLFTKKEKRLKRLSRNKPYSKLSFSIRNQGLHIVKNLFLYLKSNKSRGFLS